MNKRRNPPEAPTTLGLSPYNYGRESVQPGPGFALKKKISLIERGRMGEGGAFQQTLISR